MSNNGYGPTGWGPPEDAYEDPQYISAPAVTGPPVTAPTRLRTRRRNNKVEQRLRMAQYYEEILNSPLFGEDSDNYANQVQDEIWNYAQRRIDEIFGETPTQNESFTAEEVGALKLLAQKMLSRDESQPVPVEPQNLSAPPISRQVNTRPTYVQRAPLVSLSRPLPQITPSQPPQPPPPSPVVRRVGRPRKKTDVDSAANRPSPPPPKRYRMPQGLGMSAVMAQKAQEQAATQGTVIDGEGASMLTQ